MEFTKDPMSLCYLILHGKLAKTGVRQIVLVAVLCLCNLHRFHVNMHMLRKRLQV